MNIVVDGFYREAVNIVINVDNKGENKEDIEEPMNTYIILYAPLTNNGNNYSLQDLKTAKILSSLSKEEVRKIFRDECDKESADLSYYEGMHIEVYSLEDYLNSLPTDTYK